MTREMNRPRGRFLSMPSLVFALAFILLGWIASHSISYALADLARHDHHNSSELQMHGYMDVLELAGSGVLVLAFSLAVRSFFRYGSFGKWLHEGGISGTRKQVSLATALPAAVFVLVEYLERIAAGTGTLPSTRLLAVGVLVQLVVGLLCLALVRGTFHVAERVIVSIIQSRLVRRDRRSPAVVLESTVFACPLCPMADSAAGRAPPIQTFSSN